MERIDLTVSLDSAPTKGGDGEYLTRAEVEEIIDRRLSALRISVSEADISRAQEEARTLAGNAEF
ncbi:MAG: hypothetical protein LIO85_07220 [Rikenellaceae bacterium]|nr:hypothetical protein [Rikenellaceae bacterium]